MSSDKPKDDPSKTDKPKDDPSKTDKPKDDPSKTDKPKDDPSKTDKPKDNPSKTNLVRKDDSSKVSVTSKSKDNSNKDDKRDDEASKADSSLTSYYSLDKEIQGFVSKMDTSSAEYTEEFAFYPGTERLDYDFLAERKNMYSTNLIESIAHLIKGSLGTGILVIHEAYMQGGLWTSLAASLFIGSIIPYNMHMLVQSAQKLYVRIRVPKLSYPDVAEVSLATGPLKWCRRFSRVFRYTVDVFIFLHMFTVCCAYQIIMARTFKQTLENVSGTAEDLELTVRVYMAIIILFLMLLCMIRSLKYLAPFSVMADFFAGICVITSVYYSIAEGKNISERPAWKSVRGFMHFCGIGAYSIDGITLALPIENNMRDPNHFHIVLVYGMTLVVVVITAVGFFGYWGWGESCKSPITSHMPNTLGIDILQFLLIIMLSISFTVHFWVPFRIIWHYIGVRFKKKHAFWERIFRALLVAIISGLSLAFPNLIEMLSFAGNFFLAFVTFIFPSFIETLVSWHENRPKVKFRYNFVKNLFIIFIGVFMVYSAIYSNIQIEYNYKGHLESDM